MSPPDNDATRETLHNMKQQQQQQQQQPLSFSRTIRSRARPKSRSLSLLFWVQAFTLLFSALTLSAQARLSISSRFPTLDDTLEMATLSLLVYTFRNEPDDHQVCGLVNHRNDTNPPTTFIASQAANDIHCHWYHHDRTQGTQVMIASSRDRNYLAVVFAGTDDLRTSLTDANIWLQPYGDGNVTLLPDHPNAKVHAGFDDAVFGRDLFFQIYKRWNALRLYRPAARLFTTGHSLGAADSVLTAVGLALHYQKEQQMNQQTQQLRKRRRRHIPIVTSLSFGCPRTGNTAWRDFVHESPLLKHVGLWRFVLGWDLVPRLPEFTFDHVGHTVQFYRNTANGENATADAYYQHHGDAELELAGVPFGWASKPFIWMPGALSSHHVYRYWEFLRQWKDSTAEHQDLWIRNFVRVSDNPNTTKDDDGLLPNVDDDFWVNPPDDDAATRSAFLY